MEPVCLPYTRRNVWSAAVFLLVLVGYAAASASAYRVTQELARAPGPTEALDAAAWLLLLPTLLLALYTVPFGLYALGLACQRGSAPIAEWQLHLGLLPTAAFLLLWLCAAW